MPHAPHLRKYFGWHWRTVTRPEILDRARRGFGLPPAKWGDRELRAPCEWCHKWHAERDIEIAHLVLAPGEPHHDDPANLAALCARCHRRHDYKAWAAASYATRVARKDRARPILQLSQPEAL